MRVIISALIALLSFSANAELKFTARCLTSFLLKT